ncbi:hypothetical protein [Aeromonas sp. FDAARGOS 1402]|uniref:hypothetical protein n=1 Tax=Aeromonas sp. FDAARGOS 1402 TaxID=2778051 RepID=UPI0020B4243A|nr:hypothetical protein [Aeromonas sp. FDAARGOS 1402]
MAITHPLVCDVVAARAQGVVGLAKTMPKRTQTISCRCPANGAYSARGVARGGWLEGIQPGRQGLC